jgi:3-methyladenine DNA glycosylase/8-oxoguanine DNA glycosylase
VLAIAEKWRPYRSVATSYLFSSAFDEPDTPSAATGTAGRSID